MFMILPTREEGATSAAPGETREEPRTRVRKACNRCRVKKAKCDGHIPCARCERDKVPCRADFGPAAAKELSRSYIASLEEQQLSLLGALRELHRRAPHDSAVYDTMVQLQARGFDVGTLTRQDQAQHPDEPTRESKSPEEAPEPISWDCTDFTVGNLESLLAQPATPQAVTDFLWNFSDAQNTQEYTSQIQPDAFLSLDCLDDQSTGIINYSPNLESSHQQTHTPSRPSPLPPQCPSNDYTWSPAHRGTGSLT